MDNLPIDTAVRVDFRGVQFTGVITGMNVGCYIVRVDVMTNEIKALRNDTFDPPGCLVVHHSFVKEVIK